MSKIEYRIKEYLDTETNCGVCGVTKQYRPQRNNNSFFDRLIGGGWYNLTEYPHSSLDKAKQVIENDKLKNKIKQNKSVKYINVD
jgi:hypothetical protein